MKIFSSPSIVNYTGRYQNVHCGSMFNTIVNLLIKKSYLNDDYNHRLFSETEVNIDKNCQWWKENFASFPIVCFLSSELLNDSRHYWIATQENTGRYLQRWWCWNILQQKNDFNVHENLIIIANIMLAYYYN